MFIFKLINNNIIKAKLENNKVLDIYLLESILDEFYDLEGNFVKECVEVLKQYLDKNKAWEKVDGYDDYYYHMSMSKRQDLLDEFDYDSDELYEYGGYEEIENESSKCQAALYLIEEIEELIKVIEAIEL